MARFARGKAAARIADAAVLIGEAAPAENPASRQELFHTLPYSCSLVAQRGVQAMIGKISMTEYVQQWRLWWRDSPTVQKVGDSVCDLIVGLLKVAGVLAVFGSVTYLVYGLIVRSIVMP